MVSFINILLTFFISSTICIIEIRSNYVRACYYASWAVFREDKAKYLPENYVPGLCTHIIYAFGWMSEDFAAKAYDPSDVPSDANPNGYYGRINALKQFDPGLKTILSFGGRSFPYRMFHEMVSSAYTRHTFISTAIVWARKFGFDGIDIDWNNPDGEEDKRNLGAFLKELLDAATEESRGGWPRLILSIVTEAKREVVAKSYDIPAIAKSVDYIFVRTLDYQFHDVLEQKTGFNAPLFGRKEETDKEKKYWNVADSVDYWIQGGMPASKIVIAIPVFGRGWTLDIPKENAGPGMPAHHSSRQRKYTKNAGAAAYYEICTMLTADGTKRYFDDETKSPYLIAEQDQWFSYDDPQSIKSKLDWLRQKGLAGTYVWSLDYDDFNEICPDSNIIGRYPLIGTIARHLGDVKSLGLPVEFLKKKKHCACSLLYYNEDDGGIYLSKLLFGLIGALLLLMAFSSSFLFFFTIFLFKLRKNRFAGAGFMMDIKAYLYFNTMRNHELDPTMIDTEKLIYTGPNSRVYGARQRVAEAEFRSVAVKVPSKDAFHIKRIIEETQINARLKHPRVVEYVGFYRDAFGDVRIVSEYMAGGDLHSHLCDKKNVITVGHMLNFLRQITEGMEYLASRRIIHRDLATRNCMLNRECTDIKISDFGLSRHFNSDETYSCSSPMRLPLRWIAVECFDEDGEIFRNCKFSEKTDIWAFGVLIWECFTRGALPYGEEEFKDVVLVRLKDEGWRLPCPGACPQVLYMNLVLKCWKMRPEARPTFSTVRQLLEDTFDGIMRDTPDMTVQKVSFL